MAQVVQPDILTEKFVMEYAYKRTTGPVVGKFLTGLRDGVIFGIKASGNQVLVPPAEYDPATSDALSEFVEVGQAGTVSTWSWVTAPRPNHPLQRPFAFAIIKLDGATSGFLHVVDAGDISKMKTGMRVKVQWAAERVGSVLDIACFVPEA